MRNRLLNIFILIFAVVFIFFTSTIMVFADDSNHYCEVCSTTDNPVYHDLTALGDDARAAYDAGEMIYSGNIFFSGSEGDGEISATELIVFDVNGDFSSLWQTGQQFYNLLKPVGIILAVIYVLSEMMDRSMNDLQNPEYLAKGLMKLAIGIIIIQNGYEIATWVIQLASYTTGLLSSPVGKITDGSKLCNYSKLVGMNMWEAIGEFASLMIPWILIMIASILTTVVCWIRVLDIIIRVIFAPIGMSDIMLGGVQSQGFKYLKRLGAAGLQGAIIFAIVKAYGIISGLIGTGGGGWLAMVMLSFVVCTMVFKAGSIANEVVGVN